MIKLIQRILKSIYDKAISTFRKKHYNLTISAKVYRANTGKWEDLGIISRGNIDFKVGVK